MPRQLRLEYPGAIYHVINRGDQREPIFQDDEDRRRFLATLGEACAKTEWQVHAHCLMSNHFHLVLETPQANLVAGTKWLLGVYTKRYNIRHKLCGHLFAGRYKALIVDGSGPGYLKTVCDYVHLNPVRAKLIKVGGALASFPWSSYGEYLKAPSQRPGWLRVDRLLGEHGIPKDSAAGTGGRGRLSASAAGLVFGRRRVSARTARGGSGASRANALRCPPAGERRGEGKADVGGRSNPDISQRD